MLNDMSSPRQLFMPFLFSLLFFQEANKELILLWIRMNVIWTFFISKLITFINLQIYEITILTNFIVFGILL